MLVRLVWHAIINYEIDVTWDKNCIFCLVQKDTTKWT